MAERIELGCARRSTSQEIKIKYQKSRENGLFQYKFMHSFFVIYIAL